MDRKISKVPRRNGEDQTKAMNINSIEKEVLMQLASGKSIRDIADGTHRGYHTIHKIMEKIKLKNNYETSFRMMYEFGKNPPNHNNSI